MDEKFIRQYPSEPLRIRTGIDGDLNKLKLTTLTAELPGALGYPRSLATTRGIIIIFFSCRY